MIQDNMIEYCKNLSRRSRFVQTLGIVALLGLSHAAFASDVYAQQADKMEAGVKGKVGLGLLGAELGIVVPAIFGAKPWWLYLITGAAGGAGGAVAGHFVIDQNNQVEASVAVLAVGVAAIIPSMIMMFSATAYDPDDEIKASGDAQQGSVSGKISAENLRYPRNSLQARGQRRLAERAVSTRNPVSSGMLHMDQGVHLAVPVLSVEPKSIDNPDTRFKVALLSGSF